MTGTPDTPVRHRLRPWRPARRRGLQQHVLVRLPWLAQGIRRSILSLPPSSRLRQRALLRSIRNAVDAGARQDYEVIVANYHPEATINLVSQEGEIAVDFKKQYRGREEYREFLRGWYETWAAARFQAEEVIDWGDHWLILVRLHARGAGSGLEVEHKMGQHLWAEDGRVTRVDLYWEWNDALREAGLGPNVPQEAS